MTDSLRLLCVLAHPDDESLGTGGTVARYAAEGVETFLLTATRGEHGWLGAEREYPGPEALGRIREEELRAAAEVLGLRDVAFLDYCDGELHQAEPGAATAKIAACVRQIRPEVVITFAPDGATGHPDHIAICQLTTAAVVRAADPDDRLAGNPRAHRVAKLYYMVEPRAKLAAYDAAFGDSAMTVDGVKRRVPGWDEWMITTHIDTSAYWQQVWQAILCHRSQLRDYQALVDLPEARHRFLWGTQDFYRAFSLVNGGPAVEDDLFAGLR